MICIGTLMTQVELEMLKELFHNNDIELTFEHREAGAFLSVYMGSSPYGIDVFVSEEKAEQAAELFALMFGGAI